MAGIFTPNAPDMERVLAMRYSIPVETDIVSAIFANGMFDHVVCGPGLTVDIAGLKNKRAVDGRLYLVITEEPEKLYGWYGLHPEHATFRESTFEHLYVCDDGAYAVVVVHPRDCGFNNIDRAGLHLTNMDCTMAFLKTDIGTGVEADGTYVFKPKSLDTKQQLDITNRHAVMNKFAQIYLKAYSRLGIQVSQEAYQTTWKWICTKRFLYNSVNDDIAITDWITEMKTEPLTHII